VTEPTRTPSGLLLVSMDVDPAHEAEVNRWYWEEHFPERMGWPGFAWGARFRAVEGSAPDDPRYVAAYLMDSPAVLESADYARIAGPSEWTRRILPHIRYRRSVYSRIAPDDTSPG
jgi:hypothetical protein